MQIKTKRLLLRPFKPADLAQLQRYATRPAFIRYLPLPTQTPESVRAFFDARVEEQAQAERTRSSFAIEPKRLGHLVGAAHVAVTNAQHRCGDLGYGLDSEFEGRGIMAEAVESLIGFGFDHLDLHRIWAVADVDNGKSWRLLERVGMVREGLLRHEKLIRGEWRDSYLYAILETGRRSG